MRPVCRCVWLQTAWLRGYSNNYLARLIVHLFRNCYAELLSNASKSEFVSTKCKTSSKPSDRHPLVEPSYFPDDCLLHWLPILFGGCLDARLHPAPTPVPPEYTLHCDDATQAPHKPMIEATKKYKKKKKKTEKIGGCIKQCKRTKSIAQLPVLQKFEASNYNWMSYIVPIPICASVYQTHLLANAWWANQSNISATSHIQKRRTLG